MEQPEVIQTLVELIEVTILEEMGIDVTKMEFACTIDAIFAEEVPNEPYMLTNYEPYVRLFQAYELLKYGGENHEPKSLTL